MDRHVRRWICNKRDKVFANHLEGLEIWVLIFRLSWRLLLKISGSLFEKSERKTAIRTVRIPQELVVCTKDRWNGLKNVQNSWSRAIYLWYTSILEGHIMEFAVEGYVSFNEAKRNFFVDCKESTLPLFLYGLRFCCV